MFTGGGGGVYHRPRGLYNRPWLRVARLFADLVWDTSGRADAAHQRRLQLQEDPHRENHQFERVGVLGPPPPEEIVAAGSNV